MSRDIATRIRVSGTLVADTPLHVGGLEGNPATDMPLSMDGLGRLYIPGSSLAGPLRHWLLQNFNRKDIEVFWGRIPGKSSRDGGHASFVIIEDAIIDAHDGTEIRDGVGIDRGYGTAADGIKFDHEILPKGTEFKLEIKFEVPPNGTCGAELRAALEALARGEICFGAAKTRGLGRVKLKEGAAWSAEAFDLHTKDGVLALLDRPASGSKTSYRKGGLEILAKDAARATEKPRLRVEIIWSPVGPVMVKASAEGTEVDIMPLVTGSGNGMVAPVISGSATKGAIRCQAERILSTVCRRGVDVHDTTRDRFINQLKRSPLIEALFGAIKRRDDDEGDPPTRLGRGALAIDDCLAKSRISTATWAQLADSGKPDVGLRRDIAMHVAIDRWTGGAAPKMLYSAAEPWGLVWNPIFIDVDVARLLCACNGSERDAQAAIALLLLTLKDLAEGLVPLGYGINRGYGDIAVGRMACSVAGAKDVPWLAELATLTITQNGLKAAIAPTEPLASIDEAWQQYVVELAASPTPNQIAGEPTS